MPDFDYDSALRDPEELAAEEREREQREYAEECRLRAEERRVAEVRANGLKRRFTAVMQRATARADWMGMAWADAPEGLRDNLLKGHVSGRVDKAAALEAFTKWEELDGEQDSDILLAVADHFSFDLDDVERTFRDGGLATYDDAEDYARQYCDGMGDIPGWLENYVDYEKMGNDWLNDRSHAELPGGKIVVFD